jgi:Collagenase and related proteases
MTKLELLAPAGNKDIGIAAIDCGADAVYIAGPSFGAREAAGNPVEDIRELCGYAHIFGAKVFATVNTLLEEGETENAVKLMWDLYRAGVDAFIVQDLTLLAQDLPPVELHASTQTAIRTPEQAKKLESLGFTRLVLERQISLETIKAIRQAVSCELEFFVHGALCVSYSGQCYLSQHITGRSANRGRCAQPCRSRYDLADADGNILLKNRSILSLKDFRLDNHIGQLASAGIMSFKIEGRLKNASYVKNIVRHYRETIDRLIAELPETYCKASSGHLVGGFVPAPDATFNRGYTNAFIEGKRGSWNSADAAKSVGEYIGEIISVRGRDITISTDKTLANGDGLSFISPSGEISGIRADIVQGRTVTLKDTTGLSKGMKVYRNLNIRFERELEHNMPKRLIDVRIDCISAGGRTTFKAIAEDGRRAEVEFEETAEPAQKADAARETIARQLSKVTEPFSFTFSALESDIVYFYPASFLNDIRRQLAAQLTAQPILSSEHLHRKMVADNVLTHLDVQKELMRTKYCIKHELGLCPKQLREASIRKQRPAPVPKEPLFLINQNYKLQLSFDCKNCEMIVTL